MLQLMKQIPVHPKKDLRTVVPHADPDAFDLLKARLKVSAYVLMFCEQRVVFGVCVVYIYLTEIFGV